MGYRIVPEWFMNNPFSFKKICLTVVAVVPIDGQLFRLG
jgi:hypothetical protein